MATFLNEMDGIEAAGSSLLVLAATNRPDFIDAALLRPGRFNKLLYVPLPGEEARHAILEVHTANMPLDDSVDLHVIAKVSSKWRRIDQNWRK